LKLDFTGILKNRLTYNKKCSILYLA
jgi:hypothetical protein